MTKIYSFLIVTIVFVSNVMAQNVPSYVPTNGLVGWWPFNGNANDESGNGNHGTVNGATLTTDRDGKPNSAYSFDGKSNTISVLDNNTIDLYSNYTLACWFKINDKTFEDQAFIGKGRVSGGTGYQLTMNGDFNFYQFGFNDGNNINSGLTCPTQNSDLFSWHFLSGTYDGNIAKIYLDGNLMNSVKINFTLQNSDKPLLFGNETNALNRFLNGKLDDIAIYNRALTDQEVKQLYQGCSSEAATSTSFNSILLTTGKTVALSAVPQGGEFKGASVLNNQFVPSKAKIGLNKVQYSFKNSQGCKDSTSFSMIVADTVGNTCKKYDTVTIKNNVYDTIKITKYDTVTITNNVTKYDTILKLKFKLTTGVSENQMTSMTLYPNPTTDVLNIEIGDAKALEGYRYRILDAVGKEVYNQLVKNPITEIPLKSLGAAGMYLFEVIDQQSKTIQSNKIVLE